MSANVHAEFVVPAPNVLHECVASDDHSRCTVAFEPAHRTESGFESAVVAFDAVVCVLVRVVERGGHESFDRRSQRRGPIGHDLCRFTVSAQRGREEPPRRPDITPRRNVDVDDLTALINRSVYIAPPAGDLRWTHRARDGRRRTRAPRCHPATFTAYPGPQPMQQRLWMRGDGRSHGGPFKRSFEALERRTRAEGRTRPIRGAASSPEKSLRRARSRSPKHR